MFEEEATETFPEDGSYPVYKCRQVEIRSGRVLIWMLIVATGFFCGFVIPYVLARFGYDIPFLSIVLLFRISVIVAVIFILSYLIRYLLLLKRGTEVEAKVFAYEQRTGLFRGREKLYMKLLVERPDGHAYVLFKAKDHEELYSIHYNLRLKTFKYDCTLVKAAERKKMNYCGNADDLIHLNIMADLEHSVEVLLKRVSSIRDDLDFMLYPGIPLLFIWMLVPILCIMNGVDKPPEILFLVFFAIIPCSFVIGRVVRVFRYLQMKWMSKNVPARVWEYLPTNTVCGRPPTWRLKVLTYAEDGYRFLTFSMASQEQPFEKDDIIELQIYKDYILCERK